MADLVRLVNRPKKGKMSKNHQSCMFVKNNLYIK